MVLWVARRECGHKDGDVVELERPALERDVALVHAVSAGGVVFRDARQHSSDALTELVDVMTKLVTGQLEDKPVKMERRTQNQELDESWNGPVMEQLTLYRIEKRLKLARPKDRKAIGE